MTRKPPPPTRFPATGLVQAKPALRTIAPPPVRFAGAIGVQAKAARSSVPPPATRFSGGVGPKPRKAGDACCTKCADKPEKRPAAAAQRSLVKAVPKLVQPKSSGKPKVAQRMILSSSTKSDMLPMMTRGTYDASESRLNKSGLSMENIIDRPRMSIKPQRGMCANYNGVFNALIAGVMRQVPYDWGNLYACFDEYAINQVAIVYTGGRNGDYAAANFAAGYGATPVNYTWHHFENYNAGNNTGTMQLVLTAAHGAVFHRGGVWQWGVAHPGLFYAP